MRHLVLLLAMGAFLTSSPVTAQEIQYGTVTLETSPEDWNLEWLSEGLTLVGVNATITGPAFAAPSGFPDISISYRLNSLDAELQYLNMYIAEESTPGVYRCEADFWGMSHGNAPIIYMGARIDWVDLEAMETYASYATHPDSMLEIHMPYAIVTGVDQEGASEVFSAYPNPTAGELSLSGLGNAKSVSIHDMFGRVVMTTPAYQRMDVRHLTPGTYMLRTDSGLVHRFVKS